MTVIRNQRKPYTELALACVGFCLDRLNSKRFVRNRACNTRIVGGLIASRQASEATQLHPRQPARLDWIRCHPPSHDYRERSHTSPTHSDHSACCSGDRHRMVGQWLAKVGATSISRAYDALNAVRWCQLACASMTHVIVCSLCVFALRSVNVHVACRALLVLVKLRILLRTAPTACTACICASNHHVMPNPRPCSQG